MKYLALAVLLAITQAGPAVPRKADSTARTGSAAHTGSTVQQQAYNEKPNTADAPTAPDANQSEKHDAARNNQDRNDIQRDVSVTKLPTVSVEPDVGMYVFSFLLVVVGVLQIWLLYRTWGQIERQAGIMERQLEKERPHIQVKIEKLELSSIEGSNEVAVQEIKYTVRYYGSSNAFILEDSFDADTTDSPTGFDPVTKKTPSNRDTTIINPISATPDDRTEIVVTGQSHIDDLQCHKLFIQFHGRIRYRYFRDQVGETTVRLLWKSYGMMKKSGKPMAPGKGRWQKVGPAEANHEI